MNPRSIKNFLTSKFGLFVVFLAVLFSGLWMYGRSQVEQKRTTQLSAQRGAKVDVGRVKVALNQGLEGGIPQRAGRDAPQKNDATDGTIVPFHPPGGDPATGGARDAEKSHKISVQTLLFSYAAPPPAPHPEPPPKRFIPFGTLLKCKLVNTVDSSNLETPVIAILLEDVWQNGELVIPANTLVHGTARAGRIRDRITASGTWRFVWQDGRELPFSGIALDREYDHEIDGYGITDGSGGLRGRVLATDDLQEIKMLAAAAMSGFARGTQQQTQTVLGTTVTGSISNGAREGVANVFDLYAQRTLNDIQENGYFVRVSAGKEFYVYVTGTVNPDKAKVAGDKIEQTENSAAPAGPGSAPSTEITEQELK